MLTAKEFIEVVLIQPTKFGQLVTEKKMRVVEKKRRIYVPMEKFERYS